MPLLRDSLPSSEYPGDYYKEVIEYTELIFVLTSNISDVGIISDIYKFASATFGEETLYTGIGDIANYMTQHKIDILIENGKEFIILNDLLSSVFGYEVNAFRDENLELEAVTNIVNNLTSYTTDVINDNSSDDIGIRYNPPKLLESFGVVSPSKVTLDCLEDFVDNQYLLVEANIDSDDVKLYILQRYWYD